MGAFPKEYLVMMLSNINITFYINRKILNWTGETSSSLAVLVLGCRGLKNKNNFCPAEFVDVMHFIDLMLITKLLFIIALKKFINLANLPSLLITPSPSLSKTAKVSSASSLKTKLSVKLKDHYGKLLNSWILARQVFDYPAGANITNIEG